MDNHLTSTVAGQPDLEKDRAPVRVVIAYDDCPAYRRALRTLFNVVRELGDDSVTLRLLPRRFEFLDGADYRAYAPVDFNEAEIVMVSASATEALPEAVQLWLSECLGKTAGAVVALLGGPDRPDSSDSPRYRFVRDTAYRAGWIFFAPASSTPVPALITA